MPKVLMPIGDATEVLDTMYPYFRLPEDGFEVEVSDRGPGVPEALRDVIFDRGVTSRAADHSGLGLFSAKQLAQRLGGDLRVEAARRGGARFVAHFGTRGGHRGA